MIKRLFIIAGALLLLLVAALVAAVILIDPNDYRDRIEEIVKEATGRELRIVDDLELSVFPWIGVESGRVSFGNAEGFGPEPFAQISNARVKVRLIPLFSSRIELDTVTLHGLEVRLAVDADGRSNWDDLVAPPGERDAASPGAPKPAPEAAPGPGAEPAFALPAMLTIGGLDIRNAAIHWRDDSAGTAFDLTAFNLESGRIEVDRPVDLSLDFSFRSGEPALDGDVSLAARLTARIMDQFFMAENLRLQVRLNGDMLPVQPTTIALEGNIGVDLGRETVEMPAFALTTLGLRANGSLRGQEILDEPRLAGTFNIADIRPRELLKTLGAEAPMTADPAALSKASLAFSFETGPDHASVKDIALTLDDSQLRGNATVRGFDAPAIVFELALDQIDIDRYLSPEDAPVATPATAPAAALELPLETLRTLDIDGGLTIGRLKVSGLTMNDYRLRARAKDGVIAVTPIEAALYDGRYAGNVRLDARGDVPSFSIDESLSGVQAQPLLKDMLDIDLVSGTADFRIRATARGITDESLRRSAKGDANFSFRNGAIKGFNSAQMIREASARLQGKAPPPDVARETDFTELRGSLQIGDGLVRNEDLSASSPYLRLAGNGQVDIVKESIDYRLRARIVDTAAGQGGAGLDDVKGVDVPIRITGALMAPDIRIDSDFLRNLLRDKLAPQVEQLREEVKQKTDEKKQELKREADEEKEELKQELQEKVDQQLKRLLR